jgi:hypothetical protein
VAPDTFFEAPPVLEKEATMVKSLPEMWSSLALGEERFIPRRKPCDFGARGQVYFFSR